MLTPTIIFLSVPRSDLRLTGPFEQMLQPLLQKLDIPASSTDRIIVPCLAQQFPSIKQRFPNMTIVKSADGIADAQASMRTMSVRPELDFPYHLKLSLACWITSTLRTITPWTTCGGPLLSQLMELFLPDDVWLFKEMAAVSGSQDVFSDARHFPCIIRDNLEIRAEANDEVLVITAALAQKLYSLDNTHAEDLFNLHTTHQKLEWLRGYTTLLFKLILTPLINHGIGLEAHARPSPRSPNLP